MLACYFFSRHMERLLLILLPLNTPISMKSAKAMGVSAPSALASTLRASTFGVTWYFPSGVFFEVADRVCRLEHAADESNRVSWRTQGR
jgi:hypothetical protein